MMIPKVKAVTSDDFLTLRYPMKRKEDIIYPILTALRRRLDVNEEQFLNCSTERLSEGLIEVYYIG